MRFFDQSPENVSHLVQRCYFEADHARLKLAIDRLIELNVQFPNDPRIYYAEGILRRDHLGQGLHARNLFERAYTLSLTSPSSDDTCWSAACNAATLAGSEHEFRKWVDLTASAPPRHGGNRPRFGGHLRRLDDGEPFHNLAHTAADAQAQAGHAGSSAAHLEVALALGGADLTEEAHLRRHRAQRIRSLDLRDEKLRTSICEWFAPDERLALHEAIAELDRALEVDPYDPELWNLSSAWRILSCSFAEALQAANKADELREPYPKCHINAATALLRLGEPSEAQARIALAVRQARQLADPVDIQLAEELAETYARPKEPASLEPFVPQLETVLRAARRCLDQETQSIPLEDLVARLLTHSNRGPARSSLGYVPMIAELLSDFTPETVCGVIMNAKQRAPNLVHDWVCSTLYLISRGEGVERRDASRLLALLLFIPLDSQRICDNYRALVLAPSAAADDEIKMVHAVMQDELRRIHPDLPSLITNQPDITPSERLRAQQDILGRLKRAAPNPSSRRPDRGPGFWKSLFG